MAKANIILIETWNQDIVFVDVGSYIAPPGSQNEELWQNKFVFRVERPAGCGEVYCWDTFGRLPDTRYGGEYYTMADVIAEMSAAGA
jgi:hypothetical protein